MKKQLNGPPTLARNPIHELPQQSCEYSRIVRRVSSAAILLLIPLAAGARAVQDRSHNSPHVRHIQQRSTVHARNLMAALIPGQGVQALTVFGPPSGRQAAAGPVPAGAAWEFIGPKGYLVTTQRTYNGIHAVNGRVNDAVFDPNTAGRYYIATGGGGVWRTNDSGQTWAPLTEIQDTLSTSCIAMDPKNSDILYVGTGDFQGTEGLSLGLLKTVNASAATPTWQAVGTSSFGAFRVSRILVDPVNSQIITVSTGRGQSGSGSYGQVWRSTDAGTSWKTVIDTQAVWCDLAVGAPMADGRQVYYAAGFLDSGKRTIWRSVDRGESWVQIFTSDIIKAGDDPDTSSLTYLGASRFDPAVVYAIVTRTGSVTVMRSTNMGDSWKDITGSFPDPKNNFRQAFFNVALAVSMAQDAQGNKQDVLYVSGLDVTRGRIGADGSATWTSPGLTLTDNAIFHCDQHYAAVNPNNPNQLLLCCDGGVYNLVYNPADESSQITGLNANLGITQLYNGAYHPTNPAIALGGAQDNGSVAAKGDLSFWVGVNAGDGGYCTLNPANPGNQLVSGPELEGFRITSDAYTTGAEVDPAKGTDKARFIAPVVLDPTQPTIDYYGTNFLNSIDTTNGTIVRHVGNQQLSMDGKVSAIAVAPTNGSRIYTGSTAGELWMSQDKGATWTQINAGGAAGLAGLPTGTINMILVSSTNPDAVVVGVGGSGANGVFQCGSTSAGAARTWTPIKGAGQTALPDVPVNTLAFDFRDASGKTIFAGTDVGVFATADAGTTWIDAGRPFGLPRLKVTDLKAISGTGYLMAATFGRGFWRLPLTAPPAQRSRQASPGGIRLGAVASESKVDLSFTPVPGAASYNVKQSLTSGGPYVTIATIKTTSYEDTGLTDEALYYYVVSATVGGTESANSNEVSAQPESTPAPPRNVVAQGGDRMVTLSWDPDPGVAYYMVSRTSNPSADDVDLVADDVIDRNYVDTDVLNGVTYYYHVAAVSNAGRNSDPGGETVPVTPGGTSDSLSGAVMAAANGAATPLPGVQVRLQIMMPSTGNGDTPVGQETDTVPAGAEQTLTDSTGHYSFTGLHDGSYSVGVTPSAGQSPVPALTRALDFHVNNGRVTDANFTLAPPGNFSTGLTMISLPYDYNGTNTDSASALGLTTLTGRNLIPIATYDPAKIQYALYPFLPGNTGRQTQPGRGYWVVKTSNAPLAHPGNAVSSPFTTAISPGWNMIGDPFTTPVSVSSLVFRFSFSVDDLHANDAVSEDDAATAGLLGSTIWGYDPAQRKYVAADTLQPFQGYWIYLDPAKSANQTATVTFRNDLTE